MSRCFLFTFVVEYKGGTYICQVEAESVVSAVKTWSAEEVESIAKLSSTPIDAFGELRDEPPVLVDACRNVWCVTGSVDDELLLMNIVATSVELVSEG